MNKSPGRAEAASAETWILAGGSWKKRKEAATGAAATTTASTTSARFGGGTHHQQHPTSLSPPHSPFRSRVVIPKLQPPASSLSVRSSRSKSTGRSLPTPVVNSFSLDALSPGSASGEAAYHLPSTTRSLSSRYSETTTSLESRRSNRTSPTEHLRSVSSSRSTQQQQPHDVEAAVFEHPPFLHSSSVVSGVSSLETKRSSRTAQTEPTQLRSLGTSNSSTTAPSAVSAPTTSGSCTIPKVVVEDKKRRKKKGSSSWLKEKDDFFSATRHSESVARSRGRSPTNPREDSPPKPRNVEEPSAAPPPPRVAMAPSDN